MNPAAAVAEAKRLEAERREHKQLSAFHRRKAREAAQALARLQAECDRLGITLEITQP